MIYLKTDRVHLSSNKEDLDNFNAQAFVAACVLHANGKILLLQNKDSDANINYWGVPGGKLNLNEPPEVGVLREIHEETGLHIKPSAIEFVVKLYVRVPRIDYEFYTYKTDLSRNAFEIEIRLDDNEHINHIWVTPEEALAMDLIHGGRELLNYMYA